uniref:Leucine rich repeat malectin kinase 1 n=1 Tax=Hordeum vulgare subsp. vulgare TaxID=112509 RepID=A0A8I6WHI7_HORVV
MHISCNSARSTIIKLNISGASLNGTLDKFDFSAFPNLKKLILFQNGLHGNIPEGIGGLTSLARLRISSNRYITGTIPRGIGRLKQLTELQLGGLGLDGVALPEEIGNLTSLTKLALYSISLTGSIPLTFGRLKKLRLLNLRNNSLTGRIPPEIGNMTELHRMDLTQNYLHGQIPGTFSRLVKLNGLLLSENQLGGDVMLELGNNSVLCYIDIAKNSFSGLFPPSICAGGALITVIAAYNGFTSLRNPTFQNCTRLKCIDFRENNIVADLRGCFGKPLEQLRAMALRQNQLYGTLLTDQGEVFLCNSTGLTLLDLSNNALHGDLSNSKYLWNMPHLEFMDLSSNSLSGVVPSSSDP